MGMLLMDQLEGSELAVVNMSEVMMEGYTWALHIKKEKSLILYLYFYLFIDVVFEFECDVVLCSVHFVRFSCISRVFNLVNTTCNMQDINNRVWFEYDIRFFYFFPPRFVFYLFISLLCGEPFYFLNL